MRPEELEDWQVKFLEDLVKQDWRIEEPPEPEPEESEEIRLILEIVAQKDVEEIRVKPKVGNAFDNLGAVVYRSKTRGKQVVCCFEYRELMRGQKLVGREGGITERMIEDYKAETEAELEAKYPIVEVAK